MILWGLHISNPDTSQHGDIVVSLRPFERMTPEDVMNTFQAYIQSNHKVRIDEQFEVAVGTIQVPEGVPRTKIINTATSHEEQEVGRTNYQRWQPVALVVCRAHKMRKANEMSENVYRHNHTKFKEE